MNENNNLSSKKCEACSTGSIPLHGNELFELMKAIHPDWSLDNNTKIIRTFRFKDFMSALNFVNKIGEVAEAEGHHPDIELSWGKVKVILLTHKIHGLSINDFIMAAKIDDLAI